MNTVLASETGRNALETAYVYGKDTVIQKAGYGGRLTNESISGQGETFYRGTMRSDSDVGSQIIELNARATGTDAILDSEGAQAVQQHALEYLARMDGYKSDCKRIRSRRWQKIFLCS